MASIEQIKATILKLAGNPVTGVVADFAEEWAKAIHELDNPSKAGVPSAEKRIVEPQETR